MKGPRFSAPVAICCVLTLVVALALSPRSSAGTVSYVYDEQGRLTSASYSDGTIVCYAYDAAGNRTQYTVSGSACSLNHAAREQR